MTKLVFVAGPYFGPNDHVIRMNIEAARQVGRFCLLKGWFPFIPHSNTAMFQHLGIPEQTYLDGDLLILERMDAVVLCPGWETSKGTAGEIERAVQKGIPVYRFVEELPDLTKAVEAAE